MMAADINYFWNMCYTGCEECKEARGPNNEEGPHINHPEAHMRPSK